MKIAFFLNEFPAISETFILNQITGLLRRGHQLDIHARWPGNLASGIQHADVKRYSLLHRTQYYPVPESKLGRLLNGAHRLARWGWRNPWITFDSLNMWRHGRSALNLTLLHELLPAFELPQRYDVIHCHYGPNGQLALAWRDFGALRGPIITTFHGFDVNKLPRIEGPRLYRTLFSKGDLFTVGSEFLKRRIIALGAPADRIVKLPMGVDLSRFHFTERSKNREGELRLLTVARLVEVKGIEYALRAVAALKMKYSLLHYQIVGDGPLRGELEGLARQLGLANQVEFLGALPQDAVIERYRDAQIFVLPSIVTESGEEENQSVSLAEAQASGLPVIGTRIGGNAESIREGESGILVPPRDFSALARAVEEIAECPQAWSKMGRIGRTLVEDRFNLEKQNDELVILYRMVATQS
jgi:colanic acid/amylovoran biosynthesis glycosyltransferase